MGSCTLNVGPPLTRCYSNGVRVIWSGGELSVNVTHKLGDTVCYSVETDLGGSSQTSVIANGQGTTVARVIIPDLSGRPQIHQYICGDDPPITVELTAACQADFDDAGSEAPPCPESAACQP
jgi:hypothetical protein